MSTRENRELWGKQQHSDMEDLRILRTKNTFKKASATYTYLFHVI